MYLKSPNARVVRKGNKILLCNTKNGGFVRITEGYYDYLEAFLLHEESFEFENETIKENVYKLREALLKIHFLVDEKCFEEEQKFYYQVIYLSLTNQCNLRCKHCIVDGGTKQELSLSTHEWKKVIDQVIEFNPKEINLTGGEPLLRNDLSELLTYLRNKYNGMISLSTNAVLIDENIATKIRDKRVAVAISVDGYDQYSCEKVRGVNVFDRVINAVKLLKEIGVEKISLSMLNTSYTYEHVSEFEDMCKKLKVKSVIRRFTPAGRGADFLSELLPPITSDMPQLKQDVSCRLCRPGEKEICIIENGDVYPCVPLSGDESFKMGNILKESLKEIVGGVDWKKHIEEVRPWYQERCKDCSVHLFCHDCISYMQSVLQCQKLTDEYCSNKKVILEKILWEENK